MARPKHIVHNTFQCPKCLYKYRAPIKGTLGVAHVCPRVLPKRDLVEMRSL